MRAALNYLLFDDSTDWQRLGDKNHPELSGTLSLGQRLDQWWIDNVSAMVPLFTPLMALRPFRWKKVEVKDDFFLVEVTPTEDQ